MVSEPHGFAEVPESLAQCGIRLIGLGNLPAATIAYNCNRETGPTG